MNSNKNKTQLSIVYKITNLLNNKIYIGAHTTYNIDDRYMGSSKYLKKDMKELGRDKFKKDILFVFANSEDMRKKEAEIVTKDFCLREDTYNLMQGGVAKFSWVGTVVVKDKDGNCSRVYEEDPRYISGELVGINKGKKIDSVWKGRTHSKESKEKMSKTRKGRLRHPNTGFIKGSTLSKETKEKISLANKDKKLSNEHKNKIRLAIKEQWKIRRLKIE